MSFRCRWLPLGVLLLLACAGTVPLPVLTLMPEGPFEWARGRAVLQQHSQHGVSIQVAFERDRGEHLEWWVRIENQSQRTLHVSPDYFFYRVAETERGGRSVRAVDPNRALAQLDASRARADARETDAAEAAQQGLGFDLIDHVVNDMLGFDNPTPSERRHARDQRRATYLAERGERERWRDELAHHSVRRSTLRPGESVQGMVLFPRLEHAGRTELVVIVVPAIARFAYASRR